MIPLHLDYIMINMPKSFSFVLSPAPSSYGYSSLGSYGENPAPKDRFLRTRLLTLYHPCWRKQWMRFELFSLVVAFVMIDSN